MIEDCESVTFPRAVDALLGAGEEDAVRLGGEEVLDDELKSCADVAVANCLYASCLRSTLKVDTISVQVMLGGSRW